MRRMITNKQINLIDELNKLLTINEYNEVTVNSSWIVLGPSDDDLAIYINNEEPDGGMGIGYFDGSFGMATGGYVGDLSYGMSFNEGNVNINGTDLVQLESEDTINIESQSVLNLTGSDEVNIISYNGITITDSGNHINMTNIAGNNGIALRDEESNESVFIYAYTGMELTWDDAGSDNLLKLTGYIPTSDPHVAGAVWNDSGTLKISAGN